MWTYWRRFHKWPASGLEFIRRAAQTFQRSWDEGRTKLATGGLFTQEPTCAAGLPVRIGAPPEITLLRLIAA